MRKSQKRALLVALVAAPAFAGLARGQAQLVVSPTSVTMTSDSYENPSQLLTVTSSNGSPISFLVSSSGGAAFQVVPVGPQVCTIMTTPASFNVICSCLNRGSGTYSGSVNFAPPAPLPTVVVPVTIVVAQLGPPQITSVLNAASFANASASPGEVVSVFGANLGPAAPLGAKLDSTGKMSTSLGGVSVIFFNGSLAEYYAPLTYVSATQINCEVPYEVMQWTGAWLEVGYVGGWFIPPGPNIQLAAASPGIFTATGTGTGQAAALNYDNTPNTTSNPAPAGSIVQVYMTGEGQTSPAGVTGSVTCSNGCATTSQIPKPLSPVTAFVGGQPATVAFYGEAPALVSGVMQVNVLVPANTPSGAVSLAVTVGSNSTQAGVTIAVK